MNTKQLESQYESVPLPTEPRLLLTTADAYYWAVAEVGYEPITGAVSVRNIRLEQEPRKRR